MDDAAIGGIGFVKICRSWRLEFLLVGDLLICTMILRIFKDICRGFVGGECGTVNGFKKISSQHHRRRVWC